MNFDTKTYNVPYDSFLHSGCVSSLKDFGSFYQLSVCKFLKEGGSSDSDKIKYLMSYGLTRSDAKDMLFYFCTGYDGIFNDYPYKAPDEVVERVGRFVNALVRAKSVINQLGALNPWQWFCTFTIDPQKYDRYDFKTFYKKFSIFKMNYKRDYGVKFDYVLVPEQHQDGAWHLHGLVNNLPLDHLKEYRREDYSPFTDVKCPLYILEKLDKGEKVYSWTSFSEKFGFTVIEAIRDQSKSASYITKYIGKGFACNDHFKNARLFMPSLGLQRAKVLKKGLASIGDTKPSFDCDYVTTFKFPKSEYSLEDVMKYFSD